MPEEAQAFGANVSAGGSEDAPSASSQALGKAAATTGAAGGQATGASGQSLVARDSPDDLPELEAQTAPPASDRAR